MVFKKDLTPLGKKGTVTKHSGKGSAPQAPNPMATMTSRYPKPMPAPVAPAGPPAAMGPPPAMGPPASMGPSAPVGQMPLPFKKPPV